VLAVLIVSLVSGCGASPAAPGSALTAALGGTWVGVGSDPQGPETLTWTLIQSGTNVSGTAQLEPAITTDGSCGSCHKQKSGTVSGTIVGTVLTMTLDFPAGGSDLTPLCGIRMLATSPDVASHRIAAAYTGTTTCEGPFSDGALVMTR